jgi:diketogulonate reductase-like aldo/keto reductase
MKLNINSRIKLNTGAKMPCFGYGTWEVHEKEAVSEAIRQGYRLIDTAKIYFNEELVGRAINESGKRDELFITTKFWPVGLSGVKNSFEKSLEKLKIEHVDLYLIHWPQGNWVKAWGEMEKLPKDKCRAIGVSNFSVSQLKEIMKKYKIIPAVNQVKLSPYNYQVEKETMEFCKDNGIVFEAYSSLTRGKLLNDERLNLIAAKYKKTPAQVLLRWVLQHDAVVIPKSVHKQRIIENKEIFDFSIKKVDMEALDNFPQTRTMLF